MRKILLLFIVLAFIGCSSNKEDEQMINDTINNFYHYLNKKDYKKLSELTSPNMTKELAFLSSIYKESVKYSSIKVESIEIAGEKAVADVSTTDEFGNKVSFTWNLIKIKNSWKIDYYSRLNNNSYKEDDNSRTTNENRADSIENEKTLSLTPSTSIEEQNVNL